MYAAMLRLRSQFDVFTKGTENLSVNGSFKKIQLKLNDHNINLLGNFAVSDQTVISGFQHTGAWYEFFTGNELSVSDVNATILLKAGEYRLYSDKKLPEFKGPATVASVRLNNSGIKIFPNPATDQLLIDSSETMQQIELISVDGSIIQKMQPNATSLSLKLYGIKSGLFLIRITTPHQILTEKIVKK